MTKKIYVTPGMEIYDFQMQQKLLFGSEIDSIVADGLFDDDLTQDNVQDDTLESIWNGAW